MDKNQMRIERLRILKKIDGLNVRSQAGEDVDKELQSCGRQLDKLAKKTPRRDALDAKKSGAKKDETLVSLELEKEGAHNGVSRQLMLYRLRLGWSEKRAATTPVTKRTRSADLPISVESYRAFSDTGLSDVAIAEKVGISAMQLSRFKRKRGLTHRKSANAYTSRSKAQGVKV